MENSKTFPSFEVLDEGDVLIKNARLMTMASDDGLGVVEHGAILIRNGAIIFAGKQADVPQTSAACRDIDAGGRWVSPGFIDCHTHVIYGGNRAKEFEMRLEGASYEEIARAGGGIISTVRATRALSVDELVARALPRVDHLIAEGITTIEIKSGYGLEQEAELDMLRAARKLAALRPVTVRISCLAAHAVPEAYKGRSDDYIAEIVLPTIEAAHAEGLVDAVDGFCENIAFSTEQMARVFDKAKALGLPVKLHAEQLSNSGGAKLAASCGALSADHLEYLDEAGIAAMAAAGTVAVLLPGAFYTIHETRKPPVAALRQARVPIALATDCNPGTSPLTSLLLTMNMAATLFDIRVDECLRGVTRQAARALGLLESCGTLEPGKRADIAVWDIDEPAELVYRIGFNPLYARYFSAGSRKICAEKQTAGAARQFDPAETASVYTGRTAGHIKEEQNKMAITLSPGKVPLSDLSTIYWTGVPVKLDAASNPAIEKGAARIAEIAVGNEPVYGVNTGFGKLASIKIDATDVTTLQRNLILSHCCGVGAPLPENIVRLVMTLKLMSLGRGASGVRIEIVRLIEAMLKKGVIPLIPEKGSVGASGDLAPLAHLAAVMMGEGEAFYQNQRMNGKSALEKAGLTPVVLAAKEGLALINGTQISTALALAGLFRAYRALCAALVTGALSTDAAMGSSAPFHPDIHALRGHHGQIETARALRMLLENSAIRSSHINNDERVQDPYCIRCQPQVDGACLDLLLSAARVLEIEANAVTDNPLVLSDNSVVSGGNFHAEPVAFAADQIAIAVCEIGSIAQRRIALLVDPALSYGLPAFLAARPGLNSGLMIAEVTSAALMSENKQMAYPASVDSTPTSANQEDHVSMACHGARRLLAMTDNLFSIIGIEALAGAQGITFRGPLRTSPLLEQVITRIRKDVAVLEADRYMADDLASAARLVADGSILDVLPADILPGLEVRR